MTAGPGTRSIVAALAVLLLASCDVATQPTVTTRQSFHAISFADPREHALFKAAMNDANVPHETYIGADGLEYVRWNAEYNEPVARIRAKLFGEPLPEGRSIHFGAPYHEQFKQWLAENNISFTTQVSRGTEYIVWEAGDYPRVATWKYFPRETFEGAQRLSSDATPHAHAREVPAPAEAAGARAGRER